MRRAFARIHVLLPREGPFGVVIRRGPSKQVCTVQWTDEAFFPKGDCWLGGGLFTGNRSFWLNDSCGHSELGDTGDLERDLEFRPSGSVGGQCLSVYYPRLLRDGWTVIERVSLVKWKDFDVFEKPLALSAAVF
jgi:hypothetical protein